MQGQYPPAHLPTCPPAHLAQSGLVACMHIQTQVQIQARFDAPVLGIETKLSSRSINLQTLEDPVALATPARTRFLRFASLPSRRSRNSSANPPTALLLQSLLFPQTWLPDPRTKLDCREEEEESALKSIFVFSSLRCALLVFGLRYCNSSTVALDSFLLTLVHLGTPREAMELSSIPARHQHHQGRRSTHQNRHRKHRVATTQALGSDHKASLTLQPSRNEYAHDGEKHGLVDTWLEDIEIPQLQPVRNKESLSKQPSPKSRSRPRSTYRLRSPSPGKLLFYNSHDGQAFKASPGQRLRERKRPRDLVQGNSALDPCGEQVQARVPPGTRPVLAAPESNHESGEERSLRGSKGSVVSVISGAQYHFVKKARHKTRSDRYETTRDHKPRKPGKKKRKKSGDQGKTKETKSRGDFSSSREVMDNFNSKSILSDRITVSTPRPGQ